MPADQPLGQSMPATVTRMMIKDAGSAHASSRRGYTI